MVAGFHKTDYLTIMERIETYENYREFLKDCFEDRKKRFSFFSNRYFCKKAGITSPSLYQEVVKGKRNLTSKTIAAFSKGLNLTDCDAEYFKTLVLFNQCQTVWEKALYHESLKKFREKIPKEIIPPNQYEYFAKWYNPAIRELACLINWGDDYQLLASSLNPPIKKKEAKESVELLMKLGLLRKNNDGKYEQSSPAIASGNNVIDVRTLNKQLSELGVSAVESIPSSERHISSMTMGISGKAFFQIEQEIEEFKDRLRRIIHNDECSDAVYNINIQFFPVSRKIERNSN